MIARAPHPVFASLWALWLVGVYVALTMPERTMVGLVVLLAFLLIEIPATVTRTKGNARDTLSEVTTWIFRNTSKHRVVYRGWNAALMAGLVIPVCWLLGRTVAYYSGSLVLGALMAGGVAVWLADHFISPDVHG